MNIFYKIWNFLATKILTLKVYDLFLQGALLIVVLLEHNAFLLLRRAGDKYYITMLMEDWAIMGAAGVEFLLAVAIAWWGRHKRSLAMSGWLAATAISGLIVLAFPFDRDNSPRVELCDQLPIPELSRDSAAVLRISPQTNAAIRTVFLMTTLTFCALAKVSIWAHGLTTLDDIEPTNGPFAYGILISIQLSLGLSGKEWLRDSANQQNWWEAQLSISMLTLMFSILFLIFPKLKTLPGSEEEIDNSVQDGFLTSFKRVVKNRTIILQIGALGFLNGAVFRFFNYDREYMQALFHVDALRPDLRSSRLIGSIFRPLVIIFFIMIFRVRFSLRRRDGVKAVIASKVGGIVACATSVLFITITVLSCNDPIAGHDGHLVQSLACKDCLCDSETHGFTPVCGLDSFVTYFSPCEAGCRSYENLNEFLVFRNCSCEASGVTRGACGLPGCHLIYTLYQVFLTLILAIGGASMLMQGMVVLRAVRPRDKPLAIGVMLAVIALTGQLLSHLLYFAISNETCAFFNAGRCIFHNTSLYIMAVISAIFTVLSGVVSLVNFRLQRMAGFKENED